VRIEALIKYRREKIRSQRANVIRAWMTEDDMVQAKFSTAKINGAMKYCTAHKLVKSFGCTVMRCKYTNAEKYLVEVEDKVDDESFESLRLQEEVQAAAGELPDDFQGFSLHLAQSMGLDDAPASKSDEPKVKLESFPAIELSRLAERVKKFKDHALQRKSKYNTTAERLRLEGSKGHENLCLHYHAVVMSMAPASQSYTTSICF
ncbi:ADO2, partial [Symbiodinium necroappetens]